MKYGGRYSGTNLDAFIINLRKAIDNRISAFENHMKSKSRKNPSLNKIRSKRQWMDEYRMWTFCDDSAQKEIMKYLADMGHFEEGQK